MTTSNEQLDMGHWVLRLVAYIIDAIIIAIPTAIIYFIITFFLIFSGAGLFYYGFFLFFSFLWGIIQVLYFVFLDVYWGGTIGKRGLGLQVQTTSGGKVPLGKAFIRNITKIFWLFLIIDWLIGIATTGDKRQKYTDRIAGTIVIQTKQPFQTTAPSPASSPPPPASQPSS